MQYSKLQTSAGAASAVAGLTLLTWQISSVSALEMLAVEDKYEWDTNLSCQQCIRSDFVYVYENSATGQYFKEIPRTEANTGFCCRKETGASTYQCEKPPAGPDPRIAAMWAYYAELTATKTNKPLMQSYMNRLKNFEKDGQEIYDFYLNKLIDLHAVRLKVVEAATTAGSTAPTDDGSGFTALLDQLKPRVVYAEMSTLLGRGKAIEYLQYIEIIKTYIGVTGPSSTDPIEAAGAGDDMITADLNTLATGATGGTAFADDANFLTATSAQARIDAAKDTAVWDDVEKIIGTTKTTEFKTLIAEVAAKESITASQVYIDYIYKAFDIQNTDSYEVKLKEIRKRIANLRFRTCLTLADAITFNKLWVEMESYEGQRGDDPLASGGPSSIIRQVGYTDDYIKTLVQTTTASTNTTAQASTYTSTLNALKLEVLWYYVSWNTNVEMVADMKTYYTRYDTYASVSNSLTSRETLFQTYKDGWRGTAQQDTRFKTNYDTLRLNTYKVAVTYFMKDDPNTAVAAAGPALYTILTGSTAWQLGRSDATVTGYEDGFYVKADAATSSTYATKYRDHYWATLEEALTAYWKNTVGAINNNGMKVERFFDCWKGLTADWDTAKSTKLRYSDMKALYDKAAADNVTDFNTDIKTHYKNAYWRRAELLGWSIGLDTNTSATNTPLLSTGIIAVLHAADLNAYYEPYVLNKTYNDFKTKLTLAELNEQREKLRYTWATSYVDSTDYGLKRVISIPDADAVRFKQKIDQRYSPVTDHVGETPSTHSAPPYSTTGGSQWVLRTAYIDALITKLNNASQGVDSNAAENKLTNAYFLTNLEDPLDLDIWKTHYIKDSYADAANMRTWTDTYYDEWSGTATHVTAGGTITANAANPGTTLANIIIARRNLFRGWVDAQLTGETQVKTNLGTFFFESLKYRCDQLITANDTTGVWETANIKSDFTEILTEINAVTPSNRWDDGYDWYTKGRLLLEATDVGDFTEAVMKSTIKNLREELLLLYFKKWDEYDTGLQAHNRAASTGRAHQMFQLLDYMTTLETGTHIATDVAYDREKYISTLYDLKESDSNENLNETPSQQNADTTLDVNILRAYEQIYGELTARIDKKWTDILEQAIEINGGGSPSHANVEEKMESVNYIRFDLFGTTYYKTDILNNAANMDTFPKYQNVVTTNLMNKLSSFAGAADNTAKIVVYDQWARYTDEAYIASRLIGAGIGSIASIDNGPWTHTHSTKTYYKTWESDKVYGANKLAKWFYQWTYIDLENTTVNPSMVITELKGGLADIMGKMRQFTLGDTDNDAILEGLRRIVYEWLSKKMTVTQDATHAGEWVAALGKDWDGATAGAALGLDRTDAISVALNYATEATSDFQWSSYSMSAVYTSKTNFYYYVLDAATKERLDTGIPGYSAGATQDDPIAHYPMYETAVQKMNGTFTGLNATQYDTIWKAFLKANFQKANSDDLVFTAVDTALKTYWAYIVSQTNQTNLSLLYTTQDYTDAVADCQQTGGAGQCSSQTKKDVLSTGDEGKYVTGIWDSDDTNVWKHSGGTVYSDKAKAGFLSHQFWTAVADFDWVEELETNVTTQQNLRAGDQFYDAGGAGGANTAAAAWTYADIPKWIDNCLLGDVAQTATQNRWEYFGSAQSTNAGGFIDVTLNAKGNLHELDSTRATQHMLTTCFSFSGGYTDRLALLSGGSSGCASAIQAMTHMDATGDSATDVGLNNWFKTNQLAVVTNANWDNSYESGTADYYQQLFNDETQAGANAKDTLAQNLATLTKATKDIYDAGSTASDCQTQGKIVLDLYADALDDACMTLIKRKHSYNAETHTCTLLTQLAKKQESTSKVYHGHAYMNTLAKSMAAIAASNIALLTVGDSVAHYNEIRIADLKIAPNYFTKFSTHAGEWVYRMTSECANTSNCTGSGFTTMYDKWKVAASDGTEIVKNTDTELKLFLDMIIASIKTVWDVQETTTGWSTEIIAAGQFATMWTAVQGSEVFNVSDAASAATLVTTIAPATNFPSAYRTASSASKASVANVAGAYDVVAQKSFKYEIDQDSAMTLNGVNAAHGKAMCKSLFDAIAAISIQGAHANRNTATEYARAYMGAVKGDHTLADETKVNDLRMVIDHWGFMHQATISSPSNTDASTKWLDDVCATITSNTIQNANFNKFYYTNKVGWNTDNSPTVGGKALANSDTYGQATDANYKLLKLAIVNDKYKGTAITLDSLEADWNNGTWGLYTKQLDRSTWMVDSAANSTHGSGTTRGRVYRFETEVEARWNNSTKTTFENSIQQFSNFLYFEYFLDSETLDEYKEMRGVIWGIDHAESTAPFTATIPYYETYYATQFKECYQQFVADAASPTNTTGNKLPNEWEVDYKTVGDCYQRWLGRIRFHLWNDLEQYVVSRRAVSAPNTPTLASADLWKYRDTLRARFTYDYWLDSKGTVATTSFDNFKVCTTATTPTCANTMSTLTASDSPDSHPVVALTDGVDNKTYKIAGKKNSKDFAHPTWQLAACPHLEKNCGQKKIHLRDSRSSPVEIGINLFDAASSCHWLISAKCALPAVNIFDQTAGIEGNLIAEFVEWQDGVVKTDENGYPKDVLTVVPKKYKKPWFDDAGSLPKALTFDKDTPDVFDKEISVELLLNTLASKRSQVEFYNLELALYNLDLEIWDNAVVFSKAKYNNQISKNKQAAAAGPSEGGILDQILGAFGTTAEAVASNPKDRELIELPEKPVPPIQPSPYRGKGFKDIKADIGYGTLTEGLMSLRSDYGTKKFFGVTGQGFEVDTEYGYTFTPDLLNATKSWSDPAIAGCNNKYIALSIYPKTNKFFQGPDRLRMMITAEEPADLDFDKPEKTVPAKEPQPGPSQTLINQFYDSWEEFDEAMSGAAALGAGLTAAALIAATLY